MDTRRQNVVLGGVAVCGGSELVHEQSTVYARLELASEIESTRGNDLRHEDHAEIFLRIAPEDCACRSAPSIFADGTNAWAANGCFSPGARLAGTASIGDFRRSRETLSQAGSGQTPRWPAGNRSVRQASC